MCIIYNLQNKFFFEIQYPKLTQFVCDSHAGRGSTQPHLTALDCAQHWSYFERKYGITFARGSHIYGGLSGSAPGIFFMLLSQQRPFTCYYTRYYANTKRGLGNMPPPTIFQLADRSMKIPNSKRAPQELNLCQSLLSNPQYHLGHQSIPSGLSRVDFKPQICIFPQSLNDRK